MKDKCILITGAAHRVGAQIAQTLHTTGANVVLHYRHSKTAAEKLAEQLNSVRNNSACTIQADFADAQCYPLLIEKSIDAFGQIDGLINNASEFHPTAVENTRLEDWEQLMTSNLKAPYFLAQAALTELKKQKGVIVNILDIHADKPMKGYPVYCIAKAGLAMLTKSLAKELGPEIRVNAVAPGAVIWPEHMESQIKQEIINRTALKKAGSPEDVAQAVLFILRDARYMTGQTITIDGGRSLNL